MEKKIREEKMMRKKKKKGPREEEQDFNISNPGRTPGQIYKTVLYWI